MGHEQWETLQAFQQFLLQVPTERALLGRALLVCALRPLNLAEGRCHEQEPRRC
jgi:hypothetical protein